ncbi:hypothetical protein XOCgx_0100 [Xanthomonas oryzae pv. oryzicola]|nr:hypothetical protein XOCgx_0100 [Xanthomonas oryzae pv. oryzicola]
MRQQSRAFAQLACKQHSAVWQQTCLRQL